MVGGCLDSATDRKVPRWIRIVLLIFVTLVYAAITAAVIWLMCTAEGVVMKLIWAGIAVFFIAVFVLLWRRAAKTKA